MQQFIPDPTNKESDQPKGWRAMLPIHPAADLFPLMSEAELRELGENIKANGGLIQAVHLYKGELLDGRNRLDAMELVGLTFDDAGLNGLAHHLDRSVDPFEYVIAANLHRRHLTADQRRELIGKVLKAKPEASNRQIAEQVKVSHPTVAKVRAQLEQKGDVEKVSTSTDSKGRKQPRKRPTPTSKPRVTESPEIGTEQRRRENANLGITATARSKQNLEWFAVACREYLPNITVEMHRQEARRLVAELTQSKPA